jgi:hypothetical protein
MDCRLLPWENRDCESAWQGRTPTGPATVRRISVTEPLGYADAAVISAPASGKPSPRERARSAPHGVLTIEASATLPRSAPISHAIPAIGNDRSRGRGGNWLNAGSRIPLEFAALAI